MLGGDWGQPHCAPIRVSGGLRVRGNVTRACNTLRAGIRRGLETPPAGEARAMSHAGIRVRPGLRTWFVLAAIFLVGALQLATGNPARADGSDTEGFTQTNLVSDVAGAKNLDSHLKNPWGIVHSPTSPWWVSDNNGNVSTLYDGAGNPFPPKANGGPLVVGIPAPDGTLTGTPTGVVFSGNPNDFKVTDGKKKEPSLFIFATEDGTISGWSPNVSFTQAFIAVDNSQVPNATNGAVYKGLAIAQTESGQRLYASNFRAGTVDVFDSKFNPVHKTGAFMDSEIPEGYAPFGIQAIGSRIYVTYAKQNADRHDDVAGRGHGFIDVFTPSGFLLERLVSRGALDSPWGLEVAPQGFGPFGGKLLVGNFGDGKIHAYGLFSGRPDGTLRTEHHEPIVIDGLWALQFGTATTGGTGTLLFSAGLNGEADGLVGSINPAH
ncbi:MAG: TIGR03118 family protein [Actinobacteria bacterium]|nr:MAG: TIGR03118 family protein [Actinomycetota bacterium]